MAVRARAEEYITTHMLSNKCSGYRKTHLIMRKTRIEQNPKERSNLNFI